MTWLAMTAKGGPAPFGTSAFGWSGSVGAVAGGRRPWRAIWRTGHARVE
jgi:hypothetical protein